MLKVAISSIYILVLFFIFLFLPSIIIAQEVEEPSQNLSSLSVDFFYLKTIYRIPEIKVSNLDPESPVLQLFITSLLKGTVGIEAVLLGAYINQYYTALSAFSFIELSNFDNVQFNFFPWQLIRFGGATSLYVGRSFFLTEHLKSSLQGSIGYFHENRNVTDSENFTKRSDSLRLYLLAFNNNLHILEYIKFNIRHHVRWYDFFFITSLGGKLFITPVLFKGVRYARSSFFLEKEIGYYITPSISLSIGYYFEYIVINLLLSNIEQSIFLQIKKLVYHIIELSLSFHNTLGSRIRIYATWQRSNGRSLDFVTKYNNIYGLGFKIIF